MRLSLCSATAFAILGAAFLAGPAYSQAKPDFTGTWKINTKKSDFGGQPGPDSLVVKVEHKNNVFKYVVDGAAGGQDFHEELETPIDGKPHPGPDGFPGTVVLKWDGSVLVLEMKMDDGTLAQLGRMQLSADG
ncbi:MAG TPA: hypothetical protein VN893_17780, partial [Bryobacteraceae bacterium]|nr:hypothetical protein [Bryobacteraceae bacterium]